jgi:hypothetical protein
MRIYLRDSKLSANSPNPSLRGGVDAAVVVPPRFQSSSRSNLPVPPRFQVQAQSSSIGGDTFSTNADTPYRTPGEYPRTLGGTPPKSVSSSSLGGGMVPPGGGGGVGAGGARTISAAAFKRPAPHKSTSVDSLGVGGGGTAPLAVSMKKQLPVSPYPAQQQQIPQQLQPQRQGHQREPSGQYGADDEYDYIGAYMGSDSGSPVMGEYGGGGGGQGGRGGGYGEGKFATDLEGLR